MIENSKIYDMFFPIFYVTQVGKIFLKNFSKIIINIMCRKFFLSLKILSIVLLAMTFHGFSKFIMMYMMNFSCA